MDGSNKKLIPILIAVNAVLLVGVIVLLVIFLTRGTSQGSSSGESAKEQPTTNVSESQTGQRDSARKRDVSNVVTAVVNSIANRNKQLTPGVVEIGSSDETGLGAYVEGLSYTVSDIVVVDGTTSDILANGGKFDATQKASNSSSDTIDDEMPYIDKIVVYTGTVCDSNIGIKKGATRSSAIAIQLESGGNGKYYCQNTN